MKIEVVAWKNGFTDLKEQKISGGLWRLDQLRILTHVVILINQSIDNLFYF